MRSTLLSSLLLFLVSCRAELPERPDGTSPPSADPLSVTTTPAAPAQTIPVIGQIELRQQDGSALDPSTVALVLGDVTDVALRGYRDRARPASTVSREVPSQIWEDGGTIVVSPSVALVPGERYTVVAGSAMKQATLTATSDDVAVLRRVWPPVSFAALDDVVVLCGDEPIEAPVTWVGRMPPEISVTVRAGAIDDDRPASCITIEATGASASWPIPAALVSGERVVARLDPTPLERATTQTPTSQVSCEGGETSLASLCLTLDDDRARIRAPAPPLLLTWDVDGVRSLSVTTSTLSLLRGLAPSAPHHLRVRVRDANGGLTDGEINVTTPRSHSHPVINEVLTYPRGDTASSQWIELANDGELEADLTGYSIDDGRMDVAIPAAVIPPGGFALLVRDGFVANGVDVPPADDTLLIALPELGRGALTERGTALVLRDPNGAPISRFPASPEPTRGASVGRVSSDALDDDPTSFALALGGVPTPGAPNGLR